MISLDRLPYESLALAVMGLFDVLLAFTIAGVRARLEPTAPHYRPKGYEVASTESSR